MGCRVFCFLFFPINATVIVFTLVCFHRIQTDGLQKAQPEHKGFAPPQLFGRTGPFTNLTLTSAHLTVGSGQAETLLVS